MQSEYLSNFQVSNQLAKISELAEQNRRARRLNHFSPLDRYFWLSGSRKDGELHLHPSGDAHGDQSQRYWICNLVLRGGGTLGLAHVGFVAGLEHAGIRFAGLAGASAGSIVALGIAAARGEDLLNGVTRQIVDSTASAPMDWFIDGPRPIRVLIKHMLLRRSPYSPRIWRGLARALRRVLQQRGLNHGDTFEGWLETQMRKFGVPSIADLENQLAVVHDTLAAAEDRLRRDFPNLCADGRRVIVAQTPNATPEVKAASLMKLVTSAMPIGMKFELPGHLKYLSIDSKRVSPAKLARMSMAIPIFFDPVRIAIDRSAWRTSPILKDLKDLVAGESRKLRLDSLEELTFIDGGVFANLPLDSFEAALPDLPTILAPLVGAADPEMFARDARISSLAQDVIACAQAMRLQRDTDSYLRLRTRKQAFDHAQADSHYPRSYNIATAPIATGDADWLNFVMNENDKQELFLNGVKAAFNFLKGISDETGDEGYRKEVQSCDCPA